MRVAPFKLAPVLDASLKPSPDQSASARTATVRAAAAKMALSALWSDNWVCTLGLHPKS
jgi:hypothetical protein